MFGWRGIGAGGFRGFSSANGSLPCLAEEFGPKLSNGNNASKFQELTRWISVEIVASSWQTLCGSSTPTWFFLSHERHPKHCQGFVHIKIIGKTARLYRLFTPDAVLRLQHLVLQPRIMNIRRPSSRIPVLPFRLCPPRLAKSLSIAAATTKVKAGECLP